VFIKPFIIPLLTFSYMPQVATLWFNIIALMMKAGGIRRQPSWDNALPGTAMEIMK
jgi:hypothetical protein